MSSSYLVYVQFIMEKYRHTARSDGAVYYYYYYYLDFVWFVCLLLLFVCVGSWVRVLLFKHFMANTFDLDTEHYLTRHHSQIENGNVKPEQHIHYFSQITLSLYDLVLDVEWNISSNCFTLYNLAKYNRYMKQMLPRVTMFLPHTT